MREIIVVEFLALDAVMQAPGDPNEDRSGRWPTRSARSEPATGRTSSTGKRLFGDASATPRLKLIESKPTTTGVLINTYEPVRSR
jgi:hypothetical protein